MGDLAPEHTVQRKIGIPQLRRASLQSLPDKLVMECKGAFDIIDKENKGAVSTTEFKSMIEEKFGMTMTEEEIDQMISEVDKTGDHTVDFDSFVSMMKHHFLMSDDQDKQLLIAFQMFGDSNGCVTEKSLRTLLNKIFDDEDAPADIENMIQMAVFDEEGRMSFEKFRDMITAETLEDNGSRRSSLGDA